MPVPRAFPLPPLLCKELAACVAACTPGLAAVACVGGQCVACGRPADRPRWLQLAGQLQRWCLGPCGSGCHIRWRRYAAATTLQPMAAWPRACGRCLCPQLSAGGNTWQRAALQWRQTGALRRRLPSRRSQAMAGRRAGAAAAALRGGPTRGRPRRWPAGSRPGDYVGMDRAASASACERSATAGGRLPTLQLQRQRSDMGASVGRSTPAADCPLTAPGMSKVQRPTALPPGWA